MSLSLGLGLGLTFGKGGGGKRRPSNEYVAFAGDSRTANGFDVTTGRHYLESRGAAGWGQAACGNRFKVRRPHYGVGGDDTAELLARWSAVLADEADTIVLMIGANDRGSADFTLQQSIDNVTSMITQANTAGKVIILGNEMPYNAITGQQRTNHFDFHTWLTSAPTLFNNVYGWDSWSTTIDPATEITQTYQWLPGLADDGLHPNVEGGKVFGTSLGAAVTSTLPAVDYSTPWVSGESVPNPALNLNPGMTGTGGTKGSTGSVTGSVADSWRGDFAASDTSGVCVCSKETIGGIEYQVLTFSGTVGSTGTFTLRPLAEQTFNGLAFDMRAKVILGAGSSNLLAVSVEGRSNGTVTQQSRTLDAYVSPDLAPAGGFDLHLWTPPCAEAASPTAKRGDIVVSFVPSATIAGVVKIAAAAARQVS
jgi:lysophospholipase L1-like esterase